MFLLIYFLSVVIVAGRWYDVSKEDTDAPFWVTAIGTSLFPILNTILAVVLVYKRTRMAV